MILLLTHPLSRESVDRDYDSHCPAQTLWAGSSGFNAEGMVLLLAGSGKDGLAPAPARMERRLSLVPARARVGAGTFPFPGLRTFLSVVGVNPWFLALAPALRVLGFDFVACLLIVL
jgi:hypothetical protein